MSRIPLILFCLLMGTFANAADPQLHDTVEVFTPIESPYVMVSSYKCLRVAEKDKNRCAYKCYMRLRTSSKSAVEACFEECQHEFLIDKRQCGR